jgi:hypothetical protein
LPSLYSDSPIRSSKADLTKADSKSIPSTAVFLRYIPSTIELEWEAHINNWQNGEVCSQIQRQAIFFQKILDALDLQHYEALGRLPWGGAAAQLDVLEAEGLLSVMEYDVAGKTVRVRLEPLVGMLRDPRVSCPPHAYGSDALKELFAVDMYKQWEVQSRMWLFLDPNIMKLSPPVNAKHSLFYNLGASRWNHASGARWITRRLEAIGLNFEHIWAWEATPTTTLEYVKDASLKELAACVPSSALLSHSLFSPYFNILFPLLFIFLSQHSFL